MEITRQKHLRYLNRLTPILVILYLLQIVLYSKYAPANMQEDIRLFLGLGLSVIVAFFALTHHRYRIFMHRNYIEISFFQRKEEIFYKEISNNEIIVSFCGLKHLKLTMRDGTIKYLRSIDSPEKVLEIIRFNGRV